MRMHLHGVGVTAVAIQPGSEPAWRNAVRYHDAFLGSGVYNVM